MKVRCQYCGFITHEGRMAHNKDKFFCKAEIRCFNRLLARYLAILPVGKQMANLCFNLSQQSGRTLAEDLCSKMAELQKQWDAAIRPSGGAR